MQNPFEGFFSDLVYLEYKNHLFNYLARVKAVRGVTRNYSGRSLEIGSGISPVTSASVYTDLEQNAMKELKRQNRDGSGSLTNQNHPCFAVTDATKISFKPGSFDSVVLSEVLEHIPDDRKVLSELNSILKPQGRLVITVPVHPHYWGFDDEYVHHERRYRIPELIEKVNAAGFEVIQKKKVGGPVERLGTWLTVKLFLMLTSAPHPGASPSTLSRFAGEGKKALSPLPRTAEGEGRTRSAGVRVSERLQKFLPLYKAVNRFLSAWVRFDAWLMPENLTSIILLECRKK